MKRSAIMGLTIFAAIAIPTAAFAPPTETFVSTYHFDNHRSGWNPWETKLTPANVGPTTFGVIAQVPLDDQVDAQPLFNPNQQVTAGIYTVTPTPGIYQVVYVATENNTVYGIRRDGTVLLQRNLGTPVSPLPCVSNAPPHDGIKSTPVIDVATNTLYVMAYILISGNPTFQLFALNLSDLTDKIPPVTVVASHTLSDGTTYHFNARTQRQRPGLLLSKGNIYAGFGSYCDWTPAQSRGWLLGWQASTLAPLAHNTLTNKLATGNYFLSAIWMSGYGIAARGNGNLLFSTGNSAPNTYDGVNNIQESVVKLDSQLVNLLGIFTPFNHNVLDQGDTELSSGGVLALQAQPGPVKYMDVAAGKEGYMYLLNENNLGGFTPGGPDKVLDRKYIGKCWCGLSYFRGSDGVGRVVSSGGGTMNTAVRGAQIIVWKVQTSPTDAFVQEGAAAPMPKGTSLQVAGTFTWVSSNRTQAGTPIIWAIGRPTDPTTLAVTLYAYAAEPSSGTLPLLYSSQAGSWDNIGFIANIVPVVANGRVFVASNKQLTIFGLGGGPYVPPAAEAKLAVGAAEAKPAEGAAQAPAHEITGVLEHTDGVVLTLRTRAGKIVQVDDSDALRLGQVSVLVQGNAYTVQGSTYDSTGALRAQAVGQAHTSPVIWPPDR